MYILNYVFLLLFNTWCQIKIYRTDEDDPNCQDLLFHIKYHPYIFLTLWNFFSLQLYLLHVIVIEFITITRRPKAKLTAIKDFTFVAFILPSSLYVFCAFWAVYLIDRELIYPKKMDYCIPPYVNHCLHTTIILPILIEFVEKKITLPKLKDAVIAIICYDATFVSLMLLIYFLYEKWVYAVLEHVGPVWRVLMISSPFLMKTFVLKILYFVSNRGWKVSSDKSF